MNDITIKHIDFDNYCEYFYKENRDTYLFILNLRIDIGNINNNIHLLNIVYHLLSFRISYDSLQIIKCPVVITNCKIKFVNINNNIHLLNFIILIKYRINYLYIYI